MILARPIHCELCSNFLEEGSLAICVTDYHKDWPIGEWEAMYGRVIPEETFDAAMVLSATEDS